MNEPEIVSALKHIGDGLFAVANALKTLGDTDKVESLGGRLDDLNHSINDGLQALARSLE